jgi:hypothetical protein
MFPVPATNARLTGPRIFPIPFAAWSRPGERAPIQHCGVSTFSIILRNE